jgi:cation diffusion facilitator family transporter
MIDPKAARETARAARLSIFSNTALTLLKLVTGLLSGSISVIAEAIHSGNDLLASCIAFYAVRKAAEPADAEHGYGHGKFESLSAFIEAAMIVAAAIMVMWSAVRRIMQGGPSEIEHGPALIAMGVSAVVNVLVSRYLFRVARKHDSMALEADAWHLSADVYTSAGVFAALILITITDLHFLDPIAAILVGFLILFQGGKIGREALAQLLDRSLPEDEMALITNLLAEHNDLFMAYHRLRARKAGRERQIDLHMVTCPHITVEQAHEVCDHLEQDIRNGLPYTRVVIHVEPCDSKACPNRAASVRVPEACELRGRVAAAAQTADSRLR